VKGVIHWEINGVTGHGKPIEAGIALETVKMLNKKYGPETHWVVWCD
jgi:hypothetical protein